MNAQRRGLSLQLLSRYRAAGHDRGALYDLGWTLALEHLLWLDVGPLREAAEEPLYFITAAERLLITIAPALYTDVPDAHRGWIARGFVQACADAIEMPMAAGSDEDDEPA